MSRFCRFASGLPLVILMICLLSSLLGRQSALFQNLEDDMLSVQWALTLCLICFFSLFVTFSFRISDFPLIAFLLIGFAFYFANTTTSRDSESIALFGGVTLGKGAMTILNSRQRCRESDFKSYLVALILLLAFASCWHLDMTGNSYQGPRWMGLWDNPNIYGMLMGTGLVLATGLLVINKKRKAQIIFLLIAAGMMGVGLVFSYSRGAWVGAAMGFLYLAKAKGKLKWPLVFPIIFLVAVVVALFWHSTAATDPWYLKRLDVSRPSAQHRVSAWKAGFQIMWDHPLGVGWNKAVATYHKTYSPPDGGAGAIVTNDYLMLGTELGFLGLLCFVAYLWLSLRKNSEVRRQDSNVGKQDSEFCIRNSEYWLRITCRAGAIVLLVGFFFDGGLFKLATGATFWILLELGSERNGVQGLMFKVHSESSAIQAAKA